MEEKVKFGILYYTVPMTCYIIGCQYQNNIIPLNIAKYCNIILSVFSCRELCFLPTLDLTSDISKHCCAAHAHLVLSIYNENMHKHDGTNDVGLGLISIPFCLMPGTSQYQLDQLRWTSSLLIHISSLLHWVSSHANSHWNTLHHTEKCCGKTHHTGHHTWRRQTNEAQWGLSTVI